MDSGASSSYIDLDGLADLVEDLTSRLEHLDSKLHNLKTSTNATDVYLQNIDTIKFASEADIEQLRSALHDLSKNVHKFNCEYSQKTT
jgi:tetrahydromethanopterin S-methyltransferase subunit G